MCEVALRLSSFQSNQKPYKLIQNSQTQPYSDKILTFWRPYLNKFLADAIFKINFLASMDGINTFCVRAFHYANMISTPSRCSFNAQFTNSHLIHRTDFFSGQGDQACSKLVLLLSTTCLWGQAWVVEDIIFSQKHTCYKQVSIHWLTFTCKWFNEPTTARKWFVSLLPVHPFN